MRKLRVLGAAVVAVVAFGAAPAFAASAPIVITYEKDCNQNTGRCDGFTGAGDAFMMQVTSFQQTGKAAQLTVFEVITVGDDSFRAEMTGHATPAGFIVLNGTVTEGLYVGAQVHQRSNLTGASPGTTSWEGQLMLMPNP